MIKMNYRRTLSLILVACLFALSLNAFAFAAPQESTPFDSLGIDYEFNDLARGPSKITFKPYDISNNNVTTMTIVLRFGYYDDANGKRFFDSSVPLTYEYEIVHPDYSNAILTFTYISNVQLNYTITVTRSPGDVTVYGSGFWYWNGTALTRVTTSPIV